MKKYAGWLVVAALLVAGAGCTGAGTSTTTTTTNTNPPPTTSTDGRAVLMVKNSSAALASVSSLNVTIDKVEAHSLTNDWVTLSTASKTYDLVALNHSGSAELLADASLPAGTYDQVRVDVSGVNVTATGTTIAAKLPSNSLKIMGNFTVLAGETTTVTFDIAAGKSLHRTGDGKWIFAPVVRFMSKDHADIDIDADENVHEKSGDTESDENEGMDVNGDMHSNFELQDKLDIDSTGTVKIHTGN